MSIKDKLMNGLEDQELRLSDQQVFRRSTVLRLLRERDAIWRQLGASRSDAFAGYVSAPNPKPQTKL